MIHYFRTVFLLASCAIAAVASPTYRVVYYLEQYSQPGPLAEGSPGVFYTHVVPPEVIISVNAEGIMTPLATFQSPPSTIESSPVTAANGLLYSSVEKLLNGGSGNVFSMASAAGSQRVYPSQSFAPSPLSGNLPDGTLFGLAYGFSVGPWNLVTVDLSGNVKPFHQFPAMDRPSQVIYGTDGNYYGTAYTQNAPGSYFYRVTPTGSFTKLATLPFIGRGLLLQATDGSFYGAVPASPGCSSAGQHGAVFKLTLSGQYTVLHDFGLCRNAVVNSLIEGSDGRLYGATQGNGVLFSLTKSGDYKIEFQMTDASVEGQCPCFLLQASDGAIYGTASGGGPRGSGVIFALNAGLPPPTPRAKQFQPKSGAAGTQVRIWGENLFGASVEFNGAPAAKLVNSGPNYLWATVPQRATTGPVTVTKPGSISTTLPSFTMK
jgi:hypothetical protein